MLEKNDTSLSPPKPKSFQVVLVGYFLILFLPSQFGYHFWPPWSVPAGIRIDYLSPTFYLIDVLCLIFIFLAKPKPKYLQSIFIISAINIALSHNRYISFYHWLRIIEYYLVYLSFRKFYWFKKYWLQSLGLALLWVSVLAILQFVHGRNLGGLWWLLGERSISLAISGISKIFLPSLGYFLRPYATFPHPNPLAGFLILVLLVMFNYQTHKSLISSTSLFLKKSSLILGLSALLLTFNKTILFPLLFFLPVSLVNQSLQERLILLANYRQLVSPYLITGMGLGNYPSVSFQNLPPILPLSYQPVHNLLLLLIAEQGVPIFLYLSYLFYTICLRNAKSITNITRQLILLIFFTGLTDHYWLTSASNLLLIFVLIAITN